MSLVFGSLHDPTIIIVSLLRFSMYSCLMMNVTQEGLIKKSLESNYQSSRL